MYQSGKFQALRTQHTNDIFIFARKYFNLMVCAVVRQHIALRVQHPNILSSALINIITIQQREMQPHAKYLIETFSKYLYLKVFSRRRRCSFSSSIHLFKCMYLLPPVFGWTAAVIGYFAHQEFVRKTRQHIAFFTLYR